MQPFEWETQPIVRYSMLFMHAAVPTAPKKRKRATVEKAQMNKNANSLIERLTTKPRKLGSY